MSLELFIGLFGARAACPRSQRFSRSQMNSEGVIQCQGQRQLCCPPGAAAAAAVVPLQPVIALCPCSCCCDWQTAGWAPFNAPTGRSR